MENHIDYLNKNIDSTIYAINVLKKSMDESILKVFRAKKLHVFAGLYVYNCIRFLMEHK